MAGLRAGAGCRANGAWARCPAAVRASGGAFPGTLGGRGRVTES